MPLQRQSSGLISVVFAPLWAMSCQNTCMVAFFCALIHWAHLWLAFLMSETWAMISRGVFPAPVSVTANLLSSSHQQSHLANADSSLQSKSNILRPEELAHQMFELLCLLRRACCPLAGFLAGKLEQSWHTARRVPSKFSLFSQSRVICQLLILALLARQICFLAKFSIVSQISRNPTWNPPVDEAKFGRLRNIWTDHLIYTPKFCQAYRSPKTKMGEYGKTWHSELHLQQVNCNGSKGWA